MTNKWSKPTKLALASSNIPSETIFSHFWNFYFFWKFMLSHKREKPYFFKMSKTVVLFKLVHKVTCYEPVQNGSHVQSHTNYPFWEKFKKHLLVNSKKWKKWRKVSSERNHPKVALTNCHFFVNSDPHAKIYENPTWSFWEHISFSGILVVLFLLL